LTDDPDVQREAAVRAGKVRFEGIAPMPPPSWGPHKKLRIGYLSGDFYIHATAFLMAELFNLHDKERFEIYAYSYGRDDGSEIRKRIAREAQHFVDIRTLSDDAAAERIRADEIDVLVDMKGYTRGSRLEILARRPARSQVHWLGYPGTLGLPFVDSFIGDIVTVPPLSSSQFSEKVVRLPRCYQINDRQREIAEPKSREDYGLPAEGFVFASFNQTYKITPQLFEIWCGLLRDVSGSVLWLYESNAYASANLRAAAEKNGVASSRLVFAKSLPLAEHLARYRMVDLALDTFPVGGHTTTSDALWAGAPVVSMIGKSFVSRVAASILTAAGLAELIATSADSYRDLALSLAQNPSRLRQIKRYLQTGRSGLPLFDTPRFVKDLEFALTQISMEPVASGLSHSGD
jgi:predicted O-linked N-acetylglucosamine transferase (SPINDLY family)